MSMLLGGPTSPLPPSPSSVKIAVLALVELLPMATNVSLPPPAERRGERLGNGASPSTPAPAPTGRLLRKPLGVVKGLRAPPPRAAPDGPLLLLVAAAPTPTGGMVTCAGRCAPTALMDGVVLTVSAPDVTVARETPLPLRGGLRLLLPLRPAAPAVPVARAPSPEEELATTVLMLAIVVLVVVLLVLLLFTNIPLGAPTTPPPPLVERGGGENIVTLLLAAASDNEGRPASAGLAAGGDAPPAKML